MVDWEGAVFVGSYGGVSPATALSTLRAKRHRSKKDCNLIAATRAGSNELLRALPHPAGCVSSMPGCTAATVPRALHSHRENVRKATG